MDSFGAYSQWCKNETAQTIGMKTITDMPFFARNLIFLNSINFKKGPKHNKTTTQNNVL